MSTPEELQQKLEQLISEVNNSQLSESEIITILESNTNISEFDLEMYIENITKYTNEREDLIKEIYDISRDLEEDAEYNAEEFEQQVKLLLLSEQRLRETKLKLKILNDYEKNRSRDVETTSYYRKYYRAWSTFLGTLFFVLLINIGILYVAYKGWIPSFIPVIIIAISLFYLWIVASDLRRRDKLIFDEYDWGFDPNNVKVTTYKSDDPEPVAATEEEAGQQTCSSTTASSIEDSGGSIICEPGKIYDAALFKCVTPNETSKLSILRAMWNASGCPNSSLINDSYVIDNKRWSKSFSTDAAADMTRVCNETKEGTADSETSDMCLGVANMASEYAGEYDVYYKGQKKENDYMNIYCDGTAKQGKTLTSTTFINTSINTDIEQVRAKCSETRDANATIFIDKTHGANKYECLRKEGDSIVGSHYTGPGNFWGDVEYRLKTTQGDTYNCTQIQKCASSSAILSAGSAVISNPPSNSGTDTGDSAGADAGSSSGTETNPPSDLPDDIPGDIPSDIEGFTNYSSFKSVLIE